MLRTPHYYQFHAEIIIEGHLSEVFAVVDDIASLAKWCPSVFLAVDAIHPQREDDSAKACARLRGRGWLPYTMQWNARVIERVPNRRIVFTVSGDLVGCGELNFLPQGESVRIAYDWCVTVEKPLVKYLSCVARPLFRWNHRWAVRQGRESLQREVLRRASGEAPQPPLHPPSSLLDDRLTTT